MHLPEPVGDAALITAAQRVEHYEIAAYGTVKTFAEILGETDAAELLEETLAEEKATDETLSEIAENVNPEADAADLKPASKRNGKVSRKAKLSGTRR